MSEVLLGEPSLAQIHSNIRLAESLASQSGNDVPPERQEEILQLLRNRLNLMNRAVQLGLLERYVRICRKSSTSYPPFPITGIKACLYIIKVATDTNDLSIKEKLAIVIENWRIILEQEIDPVLAGPQPVWTCKALCQLTGRAQTTLDPPIPNSTKRKRSQDNADESHDTLIPKSSPRPQSCRTSSSRIPEDAVSQDSPRHLTPSTLNTPNGTTKELAICPNSAPTEFNKPANVETPLHHQLELLKSSSCNPVSTIKTPSVQTSSSTVTDQTPITPATSRLLLSPSNESSSALQQTKVNTPPCNTPSLNIIDHQAGLPESFKSQSSIPSQTQTSTVAQQNDQLIKTSPLTVSNPAVECNHGAHAVIVSSAPSISPVISAQVHNWQNAFRLLDSAVTELLEIMPLTPVVPLSTASFFKPSPYLPSFQWVPRSAYAYTDPPGLSLTNISPILTFQPQLETHPPPTRPVSLTNPTPSGSNHLASSEKDTEKKMHIASSSSPVTHDSVARHKLASHASPQGPLLPPAGSCARVEPAPSRPLTSSNQDSSVQPSPHQANPIPENAIADFDVTEAQKKKFVDTYRHVDAHGKAKLEATLRKSNLWHVFAPLLSTSAAPGTLSTSTPQTVSLAPERNAGAALIHPNLATTPQLSSSSKKSSPTSTAEKSMNVQTVVPPKQSLTRLSNSEPSQPMSKSVTSQPAKISFDPSSIQSAKLCKEGSLDPILSRMVSAMLVAEPQPTSLIMTALESFDIRNQEVILTHLKALAIPIHQDKDTFWQLRTHAAKPASPPTTSLIDPSFFASHHNSTHKPADLMTASRQKTELAPPQPSHPLHNGAAENLKDQHVMSEQLNSTSQPQVKPPKPQETPTESSSQIDTVGKVPEDEKEVIEIIDLEAKKVTFVRDLEGGIDTPIGEMESTQLAIVGRGGDTGSDERLSNTKRSPRRLKASLITTRQSRRPSPLGTAKIPQEKLSFNILDDGLPGFPDADPSIQIPGAPARILARYPPDQQMPPIRTFVPLLKKSRS